MGLARYSKVVVMLSTIHGEARAIVMRYFKRLWTHYFPRSNRAIRDDGFWAFAVMAASALWEMRFRTYERWISRYDTLKSKRAAKPRSGYYASGCKADNFHHFADIG